MFAYALFPLGFATTFVPPMENYFAGRLVPPLPSAVGVIPNNSLTGPGRMLHELAAFYRNVSGACGLRGSNDVCLDKLRVGAAVVRSFTMQRRQRYMETRTR